MSENEKNYKTDSRKHLFVVAVETILEKDGKFLVIQRPQGVYAGGKLAFPGGTVEQKDGEKNSEILHVAALREVAEEVGIELRDPISMLTHSSFFDEKTGLPVIHFVFYSKLKITDSTVIPNSREVPQYFWLTRQEIEKHTNSPVWLKKYLSLVKD
jgi:8-oxo-dGTP diphosphatase